MENFIDKFQISETKCINGQDVLNYINSKDIKNCLSAMKNSSEFGFDMLISMTANDLGDEFEIIYDLYSSKLMKHEYIAIKFDAGNPVVQSVASVFKSAILDEKEIFDLFGIYFDGNKNVKRFILPDSMLGNPMLKNSYLKDERLSWNE